MQRQAEADMLNQNEENPFSPFVEAQASQELIGDEVNPASDAAVEEEESTPTGVARALADINDQLAELRALILSNNQ